MTDHVEIIEIADQHRWEAAHDEAGLPSQSWHYCWALSASGFDPKLAVISSRSARMLIPFFERSFMGTTDIATILGLSGASIVPSSNEPLSVWRDYASGRGWVAGYIQLSPFLRLDPSTLGGELGEPNRVLLLDLESERLLENCSTSIRQKIRSAEREKIVLVQDRSELVESANRLYPMTFRRLGMSDQYNFSAETLERWVLDETSVVLGAQCGDNIEAISLFSVAGDHAEYHINASSMSGRNLSAWLIWNAISHFRATGVKMLNMGGGVRPEDGIYRFKKRFGGVPTPLLAVRQIYDAHKYRELCALTDIAPEGKWFPAYRQSLSTRHSSHAAKRS